MTEEVSMSALAKMVRQVVREELDRKDNQVAKAVLELVLDSKGVTVRREPHEKRVITAE